MLPQKYRLSLGKDFFLFKNQGRKIENCNMLVFCLPQKQKQKNSRFSIIISKKVSNKSTKRNWIKRQIHKNIQLNQDILKKETDVLIIAKPSILNIDKNKLQEQLSSTLKNI